MAPSSWPTSTPLLLLLLLLLCCVPGAAQVVGRKSRCNTQGYNVQCSYLQTTMDGRTVLHQTPSGTPPSSGWPAVIVFHGWYLSPTSTFSASYSDEWGLYNKALTAAALLESGYAVIAPSASSSNEDAWDTNTPPYAADLSKWSQSDDFKLLKQIFSGLQSGAFGSGCCNMKDVHAIGFSSGAYMTSRMAFSYQGVFQSLSIQSGSYYYCDGSTCPQPTSQDTPGLDNHPPTLFLHGTADPIVPPDTSTAYHNNLVNNYGRTSERYTEDGKGHQWIDSASTHIPAWIDAHSTTYSANNNGTSSSSSSSSSSSTTATTTATPVERYRARVARVLAAQDAKKKMAATMTTHHQRQHQEMEVAAATGEDASAFAARDQAPFFPFTAAPVLFDMKKGSDCLTVAGPIAAGTKLHLSPCKKPQQPPQAAEIPEWVRWTHGAIAHSANTSLCLTAVLPGGKPSSAGGRCDGDCATKLCAKAKVAGPAPLELQPCQEIRQSQANYFKHDQTAVGTLLSELCHGLCAAVSPDMSRKEGGKIIMDSCLAPSAQGFKYRVAPSPWPPTAGTGTL